VGPPAPLMNTLHHAVRLGKMSSPYASPWRMSALITEP
jgi:hypothetical protein